ncbi:MAG TPA: hypothetical protein PKI01_08490 [Bacteroidales bacterium]|nr:hypothetical protein [Bacteroidales bacterium]
MKRLPVIFVFVFFNFLAFTAFTQSTDCKFEINKTDPATKAPVKKIKTKLAGSDVFYVIISRNDTAYVLSLNFWISGTLRETIDKNDKVSIYLSGGETLTLYASSGSKPIPHYGDQAWTEYLVSYPIRSIDLGNMIELKPLKISLKAGSEPFNRDLNKNDVDRIKGIIRCIMK